jgi:ribulose 1,5-bisphosphate carboxylase large subunit-like protein
MYADGRRRNPGHPGLGAGVRALHAALHAACQGKTLDEAVRETPELDLALKKWT